MIHFLQAQSLAGIENFSPDVINAGDVVLFTLLSRQICGHYSSGLFRFQYGFAASGKVADGVLVIQSSILTDGYWERISKGRLETESTSLVTIPDSTSHVFTHSSDPNDERFCSLATFVVDVQDETVTSVDLNYGTISSFGPIGLPLNDPTQWRKFPFYVGENTNGVRLNTGYQWTLDQTLNFQNDIPFPGYYMSTNSGHKTSVEKNLLRIFYGQHDDKMYYAEYTETGGVWAYTRTLGPVNFTVGQQSATLALSQNSETKEITAYEISPAGSYTVLPETLGGYQISFVCYNYRLFTDGNIIAASAYHNYAPDWETLWPNERDYYRYKWDYDNEVWDETLLFWNQTAGVQGERSSYIDWWEDFTPESTVALMYNGVSSPWVIKEMWVIHKDGDYATVLYPFAINSEYEQMIRSFGSQNNVIFMEGLDGWEVVFRFVKDAQNKAVFSKYTKSAKNLNIPVSAVYDSTSYSYMPYFGNEAWHGYLIGEYGNYILRIDPVTDIVTRVAERKEVRMVPGAPVGESPYHFTILHDGKAAVAYTPYNLVYGTLPDIRIYSFGSDGEYRSAAFYTPILWDAAVVTSLTMSVTEPPLTETRFLLRAIDSDDWKKWDSASEHWVTHTDIFTGNTLSEFNGADHSLIPNEVGQSVYVQILLHSIDGTATPVWHSFRRVYSRGTDFRILGHATAADFEHLSSTTTEFFNDYGETITAKLFTHRLV